MNHNNQCTCESCQNEVIQSHHLAWKEKNISFTSFLNLAYIFGEKNVKTKEIYLPNGWRVLSVRDNSIITPLLLLCKDFFNWDAPERFAYRQEVYKALHGELAPVDKANFSVTKYQEKLIYSEYEDMIFANDVPKFSYFPLKKIGAEVKGNLFYHS